MKNKNLLSVLIIFSLILSGVLTGCNKDDEDPTVKSQIVGTWKVESYKYIETSGGSTDEDTELAEAGETATFNSDGSYSYKESTNGITDTGAWSLSSDEKKITMIESGYTSVFDIKEISSTKLTFYFIEVDGTDKYETYVYFKK